MKTVSAIYTQRTKDALSIDFLRLFYMRPSIKSVLVKILSKLWHSLSVALVLTMALRGEATVILQTLSNQEQKE